MEDKNGEAGFPWSLGIFDAHCHPTDTLTNLQSMPSMRAKVLTIMATRAQDQQLVANAADEYGVTEEEMMNLEMDWSKKHKVIPSFGWHPWFSHQMFLEADYSNATTLTGDQKAAHYQSVLVPRPENAIFLRSLPDPRPFGNFINQTRKYLQTYPLALVGEIGLDRSFRIPEAWLPEQVDERDASLTPGGREGRKLSPYRVSMEHQREILRAQLRLAGEMGRAVSVHGVQAHGVVYEALAETWKGHERRVLSKRERKRQGAMPAPPDEDEEDAAAAASASSAPKPYPPRVCLHSYSGAAEAIQQYCAPSVPCEVFFSFSTTVNAWAEDGAKEDGKVEAAVKALPDDRVLVESDMHIAGEEMDGQLEKVVRKICQVRGWELEEGIKQLQQNWRRFVRGR